MTDHVNRNDNYHTWHKKASHVNGKVRRISYIHYSTGKKTDPVNRTDRISYDQSTPTGIKKIGDHMLFESLEYYVFYRHKNR